MLTSQTPTTASGTVGTFGLLRVHSHPGGTGRFARADGRPERPLLAYARGSGTLGPAGRAMSVPAAALCFLPGPQVGFTGFLDGGVVLVELPAEVSARARDRIEALTGRIIPAGSGAPAFLRSFLDTLDTQLPGYQPDGPGWIQTCLCEMVERVLFECATRRLTAAERALQAAKSYARTHLTDIELTPNQVACAASVSLRTLNRLFAAEGDSVGGWIRHQRLERCRDDLLDPDQADRSIGQISALWGFLDPAHFSRTFKDAYGCSPRVYRALDGAADRSPARAHRVA